MIAPKMLMLLLTAIDANDDRDGGTITLFRCGSYAGIDVGALLLAMVAVVLTCWC